jgi:cobalt-zinc-cadmium efflux system protein
LAHSEETKNYGKAFALGVGLNVIYVGVEVTYGLSVNSSALLADAGHNASDILSLLLAWGAIWVAQWKPSGKYTYGLRKSTILASMINGMLILLAAGLITGEAVQKIQNPVEIPGNVIITVAGIGVVINAVTALLFIKDQKRDLNIKGAFLHMAADTGVSLGVVIGGLVIKYFDYYWIDPMLSFIIAGVIIYSVWGLLADSVNLAVDAVPKEIDLKQVTSFFEQMPKVAEVHDLHVWAISTTETGLTAHLVVPGGHTDQFIFEIQKKLRKKFDIDHATLQIEQSYKDDEYRNNMV